MKQNLKVNQKMRTFKDQNQNPASTMPNMNDGQRSSETAPPLRANKGHRKLRLGVPRFRLSESSKTRRGPEKGFIGMWPETA